ncbi:hypothetical protein [Nitrosopumilus ureiphilus]|uniref:hypothetical protein n=1 Tax=Nitrosopumilus ureiphilus TaxID=1470067 RepID=UPI0015CB9AF9|nr:hypothetical protein [Nitrosopumilus ureiphilus]
MRKIHTIEANVLLSYVISVLIKNNTSRLIVTDENFPVEMGTEKDIGLPHHL